MSRARHKIWFADLKLGRGPVARASGVSLLIRLAGLTLSFAQAVLTARLLGASGYGTVAVVMSVIGIVATFSQFGLGALAVREVAARVAANDAPRLRAFTRFALATVAGLSLIAAAVLAGFGLAGALVPEHYRETLTLGALLVLPGAILGLLRGLSQGFGRIALAQVPSELVRPAGLVLGMAAALLAGAHFTPEDYIYATAVAALFAALVAAVWLWLKERHWLAGPAARVAVRPHASAALPFLGLALTAMLQGEVNTLLLAWLAGPRETGLFQPIVRLTPVLTLAVQAVGMRYAPRMAEFWERGEIDRIRSVTATFTWVTTLATLATTLAIAAGGPWLMLVFGPEFQQSAPLLWWIAGAQVFSAACGPVMMLLLMERRSGNAFLAQLAGLATNFLVGVALIPTEGARGAALAMIAGIVTWTLSMLVMVRCRYGFDPGLLGIALNAGRKAR